MDEDGVDEVGGVDGGVDGGVVGGVLRGGVVRGDVVRGAVVRGAVVVGFGRVPPGFGLFGGCWITGGAVVVGGTLDGISDGTSLGRPDGGSALGGSLGPADGGTTGTPSPQLRS